MRVFLPPLWPQNTSNSTSHMGREICNEPCSPGGFEKYTLQKIKREENESRSFIKGLD